MAAYSHSRGLATVIGKRFFTQITAYSFRRSVHVSVYDRTPEEHVRGTIIPDDVIEVQSEKYWSPHPQTGVFGPVSGHNLGERGFNSLPASVGEESMLEQKIFFRPLEDLDKPQHP